MLPPRPEAESTHTRRDQLIQDNGKNYYLHLLQPEQLQQRGISAMKAQMSINA